MRKAIAAWAALVLIVLLCSLTPGLASDRDETVMTVQVSSSDHELIEGYCTLGDSTTVIAKPGSDLHKFLTRQRGRKVKVTFAETGGPELSKLVR